MYVLLRSHLIMVMIWGKCEPCWPSEKYLNFRLRPWVRIPTVHQKFTWAKLTLNGEGIRRKLVSILVRWACNMSRMEFYCKIGHAYAKCMEISDYPLHFLRIESWGTAYSAYVVHICHLHASECLEIWRWYLTRKHYCLLCYFENIGKCRSERVDRSPCCSRHW